MRQLACRASTAKWGAVGRGLLAIIVGGVLIFGLLGLDGLASFGQGAESHPRPPAPSSSDGAWPARTPEPELDLFYRDHDIERTYQADYLHLATGDPNPRSISTHGVYPWIFDVGFTLGHSIVSYQNYGSPYYHGGLDIMAPDGTDVFTRSGGQIVNIENYRPGNDLYWEVAVLDPDGYLWQFHHIEVDSIPPAIWDEWYEYQDDPVQGGFVPPDTYIGEIVYWPVVSFGKRFNHIHLNILAEGGAYVNGFAFHETLPDDDVPEILDIGLLQGGEIYMGDSIEGEYGLYVHARDLVLDNVYYLPPYKVTFSIDGGETSTVWQFDTLPGGADRVAYSTDYYVVPPTCGNYSCREFYVDLGFTTSGRREFTNVPGEHTVLVTAWDFVGNSASDSYTWMVEGPTPTPSPTQTNTPGPSPTPTNTLPPTATFTPSATPSPTTVPPTCVVLEPGKNLGFDTYINQDKPDDRKGGDSEMRVKTEADELQRPLMRFDLSAIPPEANVQSMTLSLWIKGLNGPVVDVHAHRVLQSWNELEATWNDRDRDAGEAWAAAGGTYDPDAVDTQTISAEDLFVHWDLTSLAAGWLAGDNHGVILEASVSDPKSEVKFPSNDDGDADERPQLEVCYYEGPPPTATPTPTPTHTPVPPTPTNTLPPTNTPTPTNTLPPTNAPTPSNTPTIPPTATNTPIPPTPTNTPTPTITPIPPTPTNTPSVPECVLLEPGKNLGFDAYLKQDKPDDRKGGDSEMRVKTESSKLQRALTRFDLSAVPSDATVASVTLWLWVKDLNGPPLEVSAHGVLESWNEAEVSWNDRDKDARIPWAVPGGTYDPTVVDTETIDSEKVWASWDLTALGAGWLEGANYGVILEAPVSDPKTEVKFVSNDDGDADERPRLEFCYWP